MANSVVTLVFTLVFVLISVSRCEDKSCEDKEKVECPGWKSKGFCKESSKWFGYLKEHCKKTCGFCPKTKEECKDNNNKCPSWASKNECEKNPVWMKKNCRKSCGICKTSSAECKDENKNCTSWASQNECEKNPVWMKKNCRKSCGICKTSSSACKDDHKDCPYWQSQNECQKNSVWMKKNCKKSCGICSSKNPGAVGAIEINKGSTTINDIVCGLRLKLRVVGGVDAKTGDWPWQIAMTLKWSPKQLMCGGALINEQWVLTASHCFGEADSNIITPDSIVIRIGDLNLEKDEGNEIVSNVAKIIRHEGYRRGSYDNDLALIKLEKPIKYNQNIKPVCLPKLKKPEKVNQTCYITGWGLLSEKGKLAQVLQEGKVPIVKRQICTSTLGKIASYTANMICAGYKEGGIDACQGDSGGPLVCSNGGRFELVGVVSWGQGCARKNRYGVYAKVSNYIDWIKSKIQN